MTLDRIAQIAIEHGCGGAIALPNGNVTLIDCNGDRDGWNEIRPQPGATDAYRVSDLRAALGY